MILSQDPDHAAYAAFTSKASSLVELTYLVHDFKNYQCFTDPID
jgi:hypothetical protein